MTTITFVRTLQGIERIENYEDISAYKRTCENRRSIYEKLPDDRPIKLYMDFDFKKKHAVDGAEIDDVTEQLIDLTKKHIQKELYELGIRTEPQFASKSSTQIENSIISFHLICKNYKMTKKEQRVFFERVQNSIESDKETCWRRDYLEALPSSNFIDFTVYDRNRFLRSTYSTKPDERRHFEILEGSFEDTVISYDNCNATTITIPIPEKPVKKSNYTPSGIESEEISAYLDAGLFKSLADDYKTWTEMGFAIYGVCGEEGLPLFLRFSSLCAEKYDEYDCTAWYERLEPRNDGRGMGSIKFLAKLENPKEYERISKIIANKKIEQERDEVSRMVSEHNANEYTKWKSTFEKEWCKIRDTSTFIRKYNLNDKMIMVMQNESGLVTAYKHECYFKLDENGKKKRMSFISEWLLDQNMRCYDSMDSIPPPLICPPTVFNTWVDSPYESQKILPDDPDFDIEAVKTFTEHIEILSGRNKETFDYVINWVAQSIQRPAEKMGVALNFISSQGVGKNIFTDALTRLYGGTNKKLETSQPERDVWGSFNEGLLDAFLIVLSETDKRNSVGHDGKIKALITDETMTINPKGKKGFPMQSYHRVIQNSNNEDPTMTSKDDRRNVIIRCSDEMRGNKEYFDNLISAINRPNAMRSIYWSFKVLDISGFKRGTRIETAYHTDIIEHNANPLDLFMMWIVENNTGVLELSSVELLGMFVQWKEQCRFKFGENMNVLSLIKKISLQLKLPAGAFEVKKGRLGNSRLIDTEILANHYHGDIEE